LEKRIRNSGTIPAITMADNNYFTENYRSLSNFDLKAELLYDALLDQKIDDLDIVFRSRGVFFRKFSKDVLNITQDSSNPDVLNIDTSRDGFYDILPESITHSQQGKEYRDDPVQEFKTRKKEEREARHFYNPLENELFRFRHAIERYESDFFSTINTNGIADIIKIILGIEKELPEHLLVKLFYALMKQKDNVDQDIGQTCKVLENIIGEKISYTAKNIKLEHVFDVAAAPSEMIMGINTTLESSEYIFLKKYHFSIGPLHNPENLSYYFFDEVLDNFLNTFFNLFIPLHLQFSFEVHLHPDDELFTMDQETTYKSRLGISTVL
jgi:hypothetical protein